ncbi:peptidase, partial [Streptomyces sp. SID13666]|nr:peptidase [Streptomyces sp. SID13666]
GSAGGTDGTSSGTGGGATTGGPGGGTAGTSGGPPASATPPVNRAQHIDPQKQNVVRATGSTPGAVLGAIRWVLLAVLVAGGGSALAGPAMLQWGVWRRRS